MSEESLGDDLKDKASEVADDVKEGAKKVADGAKEAAEDVKNDIKEAFSPDNPNSGKTVAIISHITVIGWIIALVMNNGNKSEIGSFYIRQSLGIFLLLLIGGWIPLVNIVIGLFCFVLWIISLIGAIGGEKKTVFLVGGYFQQWFKSL